MAVTTDPSKTGISETDALALTGTTLAPNVVNASLNSITPTGGALTVDGSISATGDATIGGELTVDDITPTDSLTIVGGSSNPSLIAENGFGGFSARFQGVVYAINGITVNGMISSWANNGNLRIGFDAGGDISLTTGFHAATPALAAQTATSTYAGSGAPNNADGSDGDFYFRSDGGALTTIYHKRTGTWTGVV